MLTKNDYRDIPKTIHYCWFGGAPLSDFANRCIASWKRFLPEYEIIEWNETNFDINMTAYTREAYSKRKYAFVSDVARYWILEQNGGLYFDVDVEVVKPLDDILKAGPYMGLEAENTTQKGVFTGSDLGVACNPGLGMAALPHMKFCSDMLGMYAGLHFLFPSGAMNTKTIVSYTSEHLLECGYDPNVAGVQKCGGFNIYPKSYFCPEIDRETHIAVLTPDTHTVHHYAGSWVSTSMKLKGRFSKILSAVLPDTALARLRSFYRFVRRKH